MFSRGSNSRGTLTWESLSLTNCYDRWDALSVIGNVYTHCAESYITRFRTLVPPNATRGRVSMLRLRGYTRWLLDSEWVNEMIGQPSQKRKSFTEAIWLVEANATGGIGGADVPNVNSQFDQEKAQLVWQRANHTVRDQAWDNAAGTGDNYIGFHPSNYFEIDVKVKRTWDRTAWGLVYTADLLEAAFTATNAPLMQLVVRGLFRAQDAL